MQKGATQEARPHTSRCTSSNEQRTACADKVDNKQGQVQVKRHAGAVVSRRLIVLTDLAVVRKAVMAVPIT